MTDETNAVNDLDALLASDPLELSKSPEDLAKIVAYYRQRRTAREAGIKPSRRDGGSAKSAPAIDLNALGLLAKPVTAKPVRR